MPHKHNLSEPLQQLCEAGIVGPVLQLRKPSLRKVKQLANKTSGGTERQPRQSDLVQLVHVSPRGRSLIHQQEEDFKHTGWTGYMCLLKRDE